MRHEKGSAPLQEYTDKIQAGRDPSDPAVSSISAYLLQPLERIQKYKAVLKVTTSDTRRPPNPPNAAFRRNELKMVSPGAHPKQSEERAELLPPGRSVRHGVRAPPALREQPPRVHD